jgi:hypothetical protein
MKINLYFKIPVENQLSKMISGNSFATKFKFTGFFIINTPLFTQSSDLNNS